MRLLLAAAILATSGSALGHGEKPSASKGVDYSKAEQMPFGRAADPKKAKRTVRVDMTDQMRFHPAEITVRRGDVVRFVPVNKGQVVHERVLATIQEPARCTWRRRTANCATPHTRPTSAPVTSEILAITIGLCVTSPILLARAAVKAYDVGSQLSKHPDPAAIMVATTHELLVMVGNKRRSTSHWKYPIRAPSRTAAVATSSIPASL